MGAQEIFIRWTCGCKTTEHWMGLLEKILSWALESTEGPKHPGLGIVPEKVRKIMKYQRKLQEWNLSL